MTNARRLLFVGETSDYYIAVGRALESAGFEVYWAQSLRSFSVLLERSGVPRHRILDLSEPREFPSDFDASLALLSEYEHPDLPRINNIHLMDRILRKKPYEFAVRYLAHCARAMRELIEREGISIVGIGRDTALQMMGLLVARRCNILWAGVTYARLPSERFLYTRSHETDGLLEIDAETPEKTAAALAFLEEFRAGVARPLMRKSSGSWAMVARRFPAHLREGRRLLRKAARDRGNDFARYTLPALGRQYVRKKLYLLQNAMVRMHEDAGARPYFFFGLHRQPESSVDVTGAYYSNQPEFVRTIARSMPAGYDLLVKVHASDADGWPASFYRELAAIPAVRLIRPHANAKKLVAGASLIITNTGTMAYEAGLLAKPAITFGKVNFNDLPTVHYCDAPRCLPAVIDAALSRKPQPGDTARIEAFLTRLFAHSFEGLPNRSLFEKPLGEVDLRAMIRTFELLHAYAHSGQR